MAITNTNYIRPIDGVNFEVSNVFYGTKVDNVRLNEGTISEIDEFFGETPEYEPSDYQNVNAVLINWNNAHGVLGFDEEHPLETTGQLLKAIDDQIKAATSSGMEEHSHDEYALTNHDHSQYATTGALSNYVDSSTLTNYAGTTHSHDNYIQDLAHEHSQYLTAHQSLAHSHANYADSSTLTNYVDSTTLTNYVDSTTLTNYVDSSTLTNYATTSALSNYVDSTVLTDYVAMSYADSHYATKNVATQETSGLMSYTDKIMLDTLNTALITICTQEEYDQMLEKDDNRIYMIR